jgi:hypothetical protein
VSPLLPALSAEEIAALVGGGDLLPSDRQCPGGCDHTLAEHQAFDAGLRAGEAGEECRVPPGVADREAWLTGHSAGACGAERKRAR